MLLCCPLRRCEQHDSQLSPQCAAALAAGALDWLAGLPLQQLLGACGATLGGSCSQQLAAPGARLSPYPALLPAAAGDAPAVVLGTLAAALHFVSSYWSVQVWHTAAEKVAAAEQLAQLGLLPGVDAAGGMTPTLQAANSMLQQLVASDAAWQVPAVGAVAAVATVELAAVLARLASTFLPQHQAAAATASLLAPLYSRVATTRFLGAAAATDATLSQPWDAARQLQLLPLARAAAAGLQAAAQSSSGGTSGTASPPLPAEAASTAQALLRFLPPGDEAAALQLMALLLSAQQLARTAAAAAAALRAGASSKVGQLAADGPTPPAMPDVRHLARLLLPGYAAPWLGLVPDPQQPRGHAAASGPEPPATTSILRPQGEAGLGCVMWSLMLLPGCQQPGPPPPSLQDLASRCRRIGCFKSCRCHQQRPASWQGQGPQLRVLSCWPWAGMSSSSSSNSRPVARQRPQLCQSASCAAQCCCCSETRNRSSPPAWCLEARWAPLGRRRRRSRQCGSARWPAGAWPLLWIASARQLLRRVATPESAPTPTTAACAAGSSRRRGS